MAICQVSGTRIHPMEATIFGGPDFKERQQLQRLLKQQIDIIAPGTLVISEGGIWTPSL